MAIRCGAKTRSGEPCKRAPVKGKTRCKLHGGASTGAPIGSSNAATHGIYRQHLTDDEQAVYDEIRLGEVDHELRVARIQLARALAAQRAADGNAELDEITDNEGGGMTIAKQSVRRKVKDYVSIIDKLMGRIESLEKTRKHLDAGDGENGEIAGFETVPYDDAP